MVVVLDIFKNFFFFFNIEILLALILHNDKEYYETTNEVDRILKPNGLVFIVEPTRSKFFRFI